MAEQKNVHPDDGPKELEGQELDQVSAGTTLTDPSTSRAGSAAVGAPKKSFAEKLGGIAEGVAQVGLGVAAN